MRLNICCGRQVLEGWINIDTVPSPRAKRPPEILADAKKIPLDDGCADEVMVIHGFEHLYRWECDVALVEWKRLLKPGGSLVLEMPDLLKCCKNLLTNYSAFNRPPEQFSMWGIYGDDRTEDPWMIHRWGWTPATLRAILKEHGFEEIRDREPKWHPMGRINRDMRMEARKP